MTDDTRLVYSTENGRICPACGKPQSKCACKGKKRKPPVLPPEAARNDGIVRIRKETKGRKGKCVSVVFGLPGGGEALKQTAKALKNLCGTGGSIKDGAIIIQGDHRQKIKAELEKQGHTVKLAGG